MSDVILQFPRETKLTSKVRLSLSGPKGILMDVSNGKFDITNQEKLWQLDEVVNTSKIFESVEETVVGMNNILILFRANEITHEKMMFNLKNTWMNCHGGFISKHTHHISVDYDIEGTDLKYIAEQTGMNVLDVIELHSSTEYTVACVGSMPGFAYLAGLPDILAIPRRHSPRTKINKGSVIIGGGQAAVLPSEGPSGWHIIGNSDINCFDIQKEKPCLFSIGDKVIFTSSKGIY